MKFARVVALVIGCLLVIPGIGLLIGGTALGAAYTFGRNDDGYIDASIDRIETDTVAVTAEDLTLNADSGSPDWLLDILDLDVQLTAASAQGDQEIFIGIAPESDVDAYLAGVAHDEIVEMRDGNTPVYRLRSGSAVVAPPTEQTFWVESATGPGTERLEWTATSGRWAVVAMNADGSPGVSADVDVGVKADFLLPLAIFMLGIGAILTAGSVALIVGATRGIARDAELVPAAVLPETPPPPAAVDTAPEPASPVRLEATLDPGLSRWMWLVKWFLAIPHLIVLVFLWIAFMVTTIVAGFAILFTGEYPRSIFEFNLGVLRWTWRVEYYAFHGGLGTDRYPPFSLGAEPDYPATLDIAYPARLSQGLVLIKWWLLAIPHYLIIWVVLGSSGALGLDPTGGVGLVGVLVLVAAFYLLFTDRYNRGLFDLIVGFNRWAYRVLAYAALMTDEYPPFRLDQGGSEPTPGGPAGPDLPSGDTIDLAQEAPSPPPVGAASS